MTALTIVAHIEAHPEKIELVKSELTKLVEPTLAETGCIQYDLHQDNNKPEQFLFFENWETRDLWQDHMKTVHIEAYKQAVEGAVVSFVVHEMSKVS
ncbi:antibiotic biosynthesis monooxygenase [Endozoicomonas sp. OPT23]|uniref:putative quinol monooxygenase n=1 Tax=Endozoicomonas sp. OPT23 TaxID=2072845 RepID=UPI00129C05A5|nr:putative quinol monooxygenase [Endozoicomonas sp. OPT23]MRI35132.1 antibiotic biosynthesis monooxygenase [Endozoicomonas sp. OPT23]